LFHENLPNRHERCKLAAMNPKAQAIFAHIVVDATFTYLLCVNKKTYEIEEKKVVEFLDIFKHTMDAMKQL